MERNIELENKATADYLELKEIVLKNENKSLEELCSELGGHNYDIGFKRFDLNFKSICATVRVINDKLTLDPSVEVWDDEKCELYNWNFIPEIN